MAVCFSPSFFCFYSFLLKWNWSWGGDSDRWLSALTLYPIRRRFHPIKNHLCTLKLNGSQAAERKGLPCVSELRKSNFLKAAAAVAGGKGSNSHDWPGPRLHTQFNPSQSAWHHINQPFISMPPHLKKKKNTTKKKTIFLFNHLWLNRASNPMTTEEDRNTPAQKLFRLNRQNGGENIQRAKPSLWSPSKKKRKKST